MSRRSVLIGLAAVVALGVALYSWFTPEIGADFASVDPGTWDLKSHKGKKLRGYLYRGDVGSHEMLVTPRTGNYRLPMDTLAWQTIDATVTTPGNGGTSCGTYRARCLSLAVQLLRKTGKTARCDHIDAPLTATCKPSNGPARVLKPRTYEVRANGQNTLLGYMCAASNGQEAWLTKKKSSPPYKSGLALKPYDLPGVTDCLCSGPTAKTAANFFAVATRKLGLTKSAVTELHGDVQFQTSCSDIKLVNALFETLDRADDGEIAASEVVSALRAAKGDLDVDIEPLVNWATTEAELAARADSSQAAMAEHAVKDAPTEEAMDEARLNPGVDKQFMMGASVDDGTWQIWVGGDVKGYALRLDDGSLELMATVDPMPLVADQIDFLKIEGEKSITSDELPDLYAWWVTLATQKGLDLASYDVLIVRDEKFKAKDQHCPTLNTPLAIGEGTYEVRNLKARASGGFEIGNLRGMYLSSGGYGGESKGQEIYHLKVGINLPLTANDDGFSLIRSEDLSERTDFSCHSKDGDDYFKDVIEELDGSYSALADYKRFMRRTEVTYTP